MMRTLLFALIMLFCQCGFSSASEFIKVYPQFRCGPISGAISVKLEAGVTASELAAAIEGQNWAKVPYKRDLWFDEGRIASVADRIRKPGKHGLAFPIPTGSEDFVSKALVSTGLVSSAGLPGGECDGDEFVVLSVLNRNYAAYERVDVFAKGFLEKLRSVLEQCKEGQDQHSCSLVNLIRYRTQPTPPHLPFAIYDVAASSELLRGVISEKRWDRVKLYVELWKIRKNDFQVRIYADEYRRARMKGQDLPKSNGYYTSPDDDWTGYSRESRIAITIAELLSQSGDIKCLDATLNAEEREMKSENKCELNDGWYRDSFEYRFKLRK